MNWLDDLKPEEFPEQYREMIRIVGFEKTVKLVKVYAKQPFYFIGLEKVIQRSKTKECNTVLEPEEFPEQYSEMIEIIGVESTIRLAKVYVKQQFYFVGLEKVIQRKKREFIMRHYKGDNHSKLARATEYSKRYVYDIIEEEKKRNAFKCRQKKLFDHA